MCWVEIKFVREDSKNEIQEVCGGRAGSGSNHHGSAALGGLQDGGGHQPVHLGSQAERLLNTLVVPLLVFRKR